MSSESDPLTEVNELTTTSSSTPALNFAQITVYSPGKSGDGLINQTAGIPTSTIAGLEGGSDEIAFSSMIRGNEIKDRDSLSIKLAAGEKSGTVMTGGVKSIFTTLGVTTIVGVTDARKLATTHVNQVFENQSAGQILSDLASQAGVSVGHVTASISYPYLVVDETMPILDHIQQLAAREGMEFYFNENNELTVERFSKTSADHTFSYGVNILGLQLRGQQPSRRYIRVYGESPSSSQGPDTWHWIAKDISSFQGEAGSGEKLLSIPDGAIRTKAAADSLAKAKLGAMKDQSVRGRLKILGNPTVKLADAVEIKKAPRDELNGLFKVTEVRHIYSKQKGYVTHVGFSGHGGADGAGNLAGGLGL